MSYSVQAAVLLFPSIGFASLALDLGWLRSVDAELQNAADSAALAGAGHLGSTDAVTSAAQTFAAMHTAGGNPLKLASDQVQIGNWDGKTWTAGKTGSFVRVTAQLDSPTLLANVFGVSSLSTSRTAIAGIRGAVQCGLVSLAKVELNGKSTVDSYDSTLGVSPRTFGADAGICSNNPAVTVEGNMVVNGGVLAGPAGAVTLRDSAKVTGSMGALSQAIKPVVVTKPGTYAALPASVTTAVTLPPGNYYRKGNFLVSGAGMLVVTGKTDIYVDGDVSIDGLGFANKSMDPHLLTINIIGAHSGHNNGSSTFYGSIIAPQSELELNGSAATYGFVFGEYVHLNGGAKFHFDTSLITDKTMGGTPVLLN